MSVAVRFHKSQVGSSLCQSTVASHHQMLQSLSSSSPSNHVRVQLRHITRMLQSLSSSSPSNHVRVQLRHITRMLQSLSSSSPSNSLSSSLRTDRGGGQHAGIGLTGQQLHCPHVSSTMGGT